MGQDLNFNESLLAELLSILYHFQCQFLFLFVVKDAKDLAIGALSDQA